MTKKKLTKLKISDTTLVPERPIQYKIYFPTLDPQNLNVKGTQINRILKKYFKQKHIKTFYLPKIKTKNFSLLKSPFVYKSAFHQYWAQRFMAVCVIELEKDTGEFKKEVLTKLKKNLSFTVRITRLELKGGEVLAAWAEDINETWWIDGFSEDNFGN